MKDEDVEEAKLDPKDLLAEYDAYLKSKVEQRMEVDDENEEEK